MKRHTSIKNSTLILKHGGEGGSIQLITDGKFFLYTTDQTTMLDFLAGEFSEKELKHTSPIFSTFDEAFASLMKRYPVFHLYPLNIDPKYLEKVKINFLKYRSANSSGHQLGFDRWENFIGH